jgi:hypothetical protein
MTEVCFTWLLIVLLCEGVWSVRFEEKMRVEYVEAYGAKVSSSRCKSK